MIGPKTRRIAVLGTRAEQVLHDDSLAPRVGSRVLDAAGDREATERLDRSAAKRQFRQVERDRLVGERGSCGRS